MMARLYAENQCDAIELKKLKDEATDKPGDEEAEGGEAPKGDGTEEPELDPEDLDTETLATIGAAYLKGPGKGGKARRRLF